MTVDQADDESGEWMMLRRECATASSFGDTAKRGKSTSVTPLVTKLLRIWRTVYNICNPVWS